jgi:NAD(P)H-hydrate epimerase
MKVSRVSEMRALDQLAIEEFGIPEELLMENAGLAASHILQKELGITDRTFIVICGVGNNGGDGFVVARKIHSNGSTVKVYILGDQTRFKGAARLNLEILERLPVEVEALEDIEPLRIALAHCHGIVDAIFGTGLTREVDGLYRDVIDEINRSAKPVLSLDIPSGVHGNTGKVMGEAVRAAHTVSFGLPKLGNVLYPGFELGGRLHVTHISFPPGMHCADSLKVALNQPLALPPRDADGHKGDFGQVLFVAGAASYFGAPYFAALSFLKAGGGYSRLAAPASMTPFIANKGSEIVFIPQQETEAGSIALANKASLVELANRMDMVVLGPGLSLGDETQQLARELTAEITAPLLIDGDGITALCRDLQIIKARTAATVLTPHLGEMARITGQDVSDIDTHKVDVLQRACSELNAVIVLKGAHSLIGYPDESIFINLSGNSGMATAGSGDVLTGSIAGLFGLGLALQDAVRQGVYIHGLAGDLAAQAKGEDGITAQDILDYLPAALSTRRQELDDPLAGICLL